jgi:tetratricopeptide (TPR) repeat protein
VQFSFSISDLKKSVPGATALSSLAGDALVAKLREVLGKVAEDAEVTVEGDLVTIRPNPPTESTAQEAERLSKKAAVRARQGEYEKAAGIYRRVLELDPGRQDSRREFAMVLVEMGKTSESLDALLDVLKVNPRDHQALVILGNHYARIERDLPSAARFLGRATEIAPDDAWAENSLGAVFFELKKPEEALRHFARALELKPGFAHALYGKSLVLTHEGRFAEALKCLQSIFQQSDPADSRARPMLENARDSFLKITNIVANDRADETFRISEDLKAQAAVESGFPIVVEQKELPGTICGVAQMAWKYRRDYHLVTLQSQLPAEMLILESEEESEGQLTRDASAAFQGVPLSRTRLYYWPLAKRERNAAGRPGKLHVKCAIVDDTALISSANLTDDAFNRNMELGLLIREPATVISLAEHFSELIRSSILLKVPHCRP